jgi:hypothetical protein
MTAALVVTVAVVVARWYIHRVGRRVTSDSLRPGAHRARDQRAVQGGHRAR